MSDNLTNETMNPIFAELARELSAPLGSEIAVSEPPEFADLLVDSALSGRHRDSEDSQGEVTALADESAQGNGPEAPEQRTGGRHAQPT
ncbi:hypothetical protein SAMN04487905_108184 [Actinopolyspora xinjiangensis]|uniref:Uncharacterized protein n=1 Tax=Actinopolyspora xinjiangensis TaxID=405564 RepID=A0A1H0VDB7_9ACTN|nr:hypothetical protein [Actinopolyspora xinjiangensis]SDP76225.1 hypothetical protein SAMN04487905_108184 [Actinopolyspora xinjiangensis]